MIKFRLAVDWATVRPILTQPGPVFCRPIKAQRPISAQIWLLGPISDFLNTLRGLKIDDWIWCLALITYLGKYSV